VRELQLLRPDHYAAVLAFELDNRAFFARSVPDRGDAYFEHIDARLDALVVDQRAGLAAFYVLVGDDASVLGRFNLEFESEANARLGYRVAERVCGQGVATAAVLEVCRLAATRHGMRTVRAAAADRNAASRRVLIKAGFQQVRPADPADLGGETGSWYQRNLEPDASAG
jgi:ribosomal-protein-alanine N-acetyltransferase